MNTRVTMVGISVLVLVLSSSAFCCSVVFVQTPAQVPRDVVVRLKLGNEPIGGVELFLRDQTGVTLRRVKSDDEGRAEFRNLHKGDYSITSAISDDLIKSTGTVGSREISLSLRTGQSISALAALAQRKPITVASVEGTVYDVSGAVVPGAVVVVEDLDTLQTPVAVATSDRRGQINISAKPGLYMMRVASPGFSTAVVPLHVEPSGSPGFKLTLHVADCKGDSNYSVEAYQSH